MPDSSSPTGIIERYLTQHMARGIDLDQRRDFYEKTLYLMAVGFNGVGLEITRKNQSGSASTDMIQTWGAEILSDAGNNFAVI